MMEVFEIKKALGLSPYKREGVLDLTGPRERYLEQLMNEAADRGLFQGYVFHVFKNEEFYLGLYKEEVSPGNGYMTSFACEIVVNLDTAYLIKVRKFSVHEVGKVTDFKEQIWMKYYGPQEAV